MSLTPWEFVLDHLNEWGYLFELIPEPFILLLLFDLRDIDMDLLDMRDLLRDFYEQY